MRAERANSSCGGRRGKGCGCSWTQHWALLPAAPSDTRAPSSAFRWPVLKATPSAAPASGSRQIPALPHAILEAHRAIRHTNFGEYCGGAC